MNYGIIRVGKFNKAAVKGINVHDTRVRGRSNTNPDIDWSRSYLNYNLHETDLTVAPDLNYLKQINQRISELDLKRAVRKDANIMAQLLVTATPEWMSSLTREEQQLYFFDAYNWACNRYGRENVISAVVHMDEANPHMHMNFVPVTSAGVLSYDQLFNQFRRKDFTKLQDDFAEHNKAKGYDVERGQAGSKAEYLRPAEYKAVQKEKTSVLELKAENVALRAEISSLKVENGELKENLAEVQSALNTLIESVTAKIKAVYEDIVEKLVNPIIQALRQGYNHRTLVSPSLAEAIIQTTSDKIKDDGYKKLSENLYNLEPAFSPEISSLGSTLENRSRSFGISY